MIATWFVLVVGASTVLASEQSCDPAPADADVKVLECQLNAESVAAYSSNSMCRMIGASFVPDFNCRYANSGCSALDSATTAVGQATTCSALNSAMTALCAEIGTCYGASANSNTPASEPCFPSSAMVTMADGKRVTVGALTEGDEIVAATADGLIATDVVSLLSIAKPGAEGHSFLMLATAANASLALTPHHHLPVGHACCSTLKKAKDVAVGERVWVLRTGKPAATTVTAITVTSSKGLHSPVLLNGGFPVVDEIVTAFDSIEKVCFATHKPSVLFKAARQFLTATQSRTPSAQLTL